MKRKILDKMLAWKKEWAGRTALLIEGMRRVGKSYSAEEFAKAEYKSYILIDFQQAPDEVKGLFNDYLDDLDSLFLYLSTYYNTELHVGESLIIFDEVQLFPRARSAIKHLVADGRYHYVETGSLMGIKENTKDILIPSEERSIELLPMDFEEFLWALGENSMMGLIKSSYESRKPLPHALHRKAMDLFRQYLAIGGMPQAVKEYVETRNFTRVDLIKRDILALYRRDITKYAGRAASKVTSIFDAIPSELQRHERRFSISSLNEGARSRDYEDAFFWLVDAKIVNVASASTEPTIGLNLNRDKSMFKCYMSDTGLLISHAFNEERIISEELYKKILFDKLEMNLGMIVENIVAQMLVASAHKLFFFSSSSRTDAESRMEIDFLIAKSRITNRHNISPIEVKSGKNYTLSSLKKFMSKYREQTFIPYVLHPGMMKEEDGIVFLPLYMTSLLGS